MRQKDGLVAMCPKFEARVDHLAKSWIYCHDFTLEFDNRETRDEYYRSTCCKSTGECPAATHYRMKWRGTT